MKPRFRALALLLPLVAMAARCKKNADLATTSSVVLDLTHAVGTAPLAFDGTSYAKSNGQTFKVTKFKYLLSNVQLLRADGIAYAAPESYYLVYAAQIATLHLVVPGVPLVDYTGLRFLVGVGAARNTAGAQTGALDPNNDLYWDWTAGYVCLKMEGISPQAPHAAAAAGLRFHIGDNVHPQVHHYSGRGPAGRGGHLGAHRVPAGERSGLVRKRRSPQQKYRL